MSPHPCCRAGGAAATASQTNAAPVRFIRRIRNAAGWIAWNSNETTVNAKNNGNPGEDSRFAEYNSMDLSGNSISITGRVSWSHQLTASQAADYTLLNIFADNPDTWFGLGYSGVAQAGYMLAGVVVATQLGISATVLYLIAYVIMNLAAFAVIYAQEVELGHDRISGLAGQALKRLPEVIDVVPAETRLPALLDKAKPPAVGALGRAALRGEPN